MLELSDRDIEIILDNQEKKKSSSDSSGIQLEIVQSRGGLGHFNKLLVKNVREKAPFFS